MPLRPWPGSFRMVTLVVAGALLVPAAAFAGTVSLDPGFTFRAAPVPGWDGIVHCEVLVVEPQRCLRYSWRGGSDRIQEYGQRLDTVATWTLAPTGRGHWIQCAYDNTTAVLSRRLPETVNTCAVTYERSTKAVNALPVVKHVTCK